MVIGHVCSSMRTHIAEIGSRDVTIYSSMRMYYIGTSMSIYSIHILVRVYSSMTRVCSKMSSMLCHVDRSMTTHT